MPHSTTVKLLVILTLLFSAGCAGLTSPSPPSKERSEPFVYQSHLGDATAKAYYHFSLAIMRHNQGDLAGVVTSLEETLRYDSQTSGLRLYLAEVLLQLNREEEALRHLEDVLIDDPQSIQAHRLLGEVLFEKQRFDAAARHFRRLTELSPDDQDAVLLLVQTQARRGDTVEAIETLRDFLASHDDSYRGYYALARLYRQIDLSVSAEQAYRKVITLQPRLLPVYLELGQLYEQRQQQGDQERAMAIYRAGLKERPDEPGLRHRLVQLLLQREDFRQAEQQLQLLLEANPDDAEALRKYGLLQMEQQQWSQAVRSFEHLLSLSKERDAIRYYLGNAYEQVAQPYEALREFLQIPQESELYPDARIHAAYLYRMLGEAQQAYTALLPLLDDQRLAVDHVLLMASLAGDGGYPNEALQIFQQGEQRFPGNTRIIYQRGSLLEKIGMRDAARLAMEEILALDPYHAEAMNFIAYQYAEEGVELEEALRLAERAIELNEAGHIYDTLGWILYRLKRYPAALEALQAALREIPDDAVIHEHLGDVYVALQRPDEARRLYRKALELTPENRALRDKMEALP